MGSFELDTYRHKNKGRKKNGQFDRYVFFFHQIFQTIRTYLSLVAGNQRKKSMDPKISSILKISGLLAIKNTVKQGKA